MSSTMPTRLLFLPDSPELRFLPEGPYALPEGKFSWVAIQHGATGTTGSLCIYDLTTDVNHVFSLPGRPGFAFPTQDRHKFVVGMEHDLGIFDCDTLDWSPFCTGVDSDVVGTIVNDGVVFPQGLIFGTKDLQFAEKKAGLYLWRASDQQ